MSVARVEELNIAIIGSGQCLSQFGFRAARGCLRRVRKHLPFCLNLFIEAILMMTKVAGYGFSVLGGCWNVRKSWSARPYTFEEGKCSKEITRGQVVA